jgi:hypothetical protein
MLAIVCVLLQAGCATPAPGNGAGASALVLSVDRGQYRAGDAMVLTLRNGLPHGVGYNLCGAGLERRVGGEWREVQQRLAEVCTMELRTLAPGASDTFRHTVPAGLSAGEYRVRSAVESPLGGSWVGVASAAFTITS